MFNCDCKPYRLVLDTWSKSKMRESDPKTLKPYPSPEYFIPPALKKTKSSNSTSEKSECGNCVFPFLYGGRIHDICTTIDGDDKPWCSLTYEWTGLWEYCTGSNCPGVDLPADNMTVSPGNEVGSCCKFFTFSDY